MTKLKNAVVGTMALGVLLVPGSSVANDKPATSSAKATATFEEVKSRCLKGIDDREARLARLATKVGQTADEHDPALQAIIVTSQSGLIALKAAVETNNSDLVALKRDCQRIVTDLRIYALRVPQINLVMSIDKLATVTAKIDGIDVAGLLAITPAGYNVDKKMLNPYLQSVRSARADLEKISQFARQ